jgi:hypothetical protein
MARGGRRSGVTAIIVTSLAIIIITFIRTIARLNKIGSALA